MHLLWWFVWFTLIFWIFAVPYDVPGQRARQESLLGILRKHLASGQISQDEYEARKALLANEKANWGL